jgi:hypothetical protein
LKKLFGPRPASVSDDRVHEFSQQVEYSKLRVDKIGKLTTFEIAHCYAEIGYSYACEREFQADGRWVHQRNKFLKEFEIAPIETDLILRTFNQINYFYAQREVEQKVLHPLDFLTTSNRILLFEQQKPLGFRHREVQYGARQDVDFLDVRRGYKALLGMPSGAIVQSLAQWHATVDLCQKRVETAVVLMIALIAIHPFSDANGRLARLAFFWLMKKWNMPARYIKEGSDGEFFRCGQGLKSTEHLMREATAYICGNQNVIIPGFFEKHTKASGEKMIEAFSFHMKQLSDMPEELLDQENIRNLLRHYERFGHITDKPQNFLCLA